MRDNNGFTLIEILVAIAVTSVIMAGAYMAFNSQQKTTVVQSDVSDLQMNLRAALDYIARDIRLAGCDPQKHDFNNSNDTLGLEEISCDEANNADAIALTWKDEDSTIHDASYKLDAGNLVDINNAVISNNIIALGFAYACDADSDGELDTNAAGQTEWLVPVDNGASQDWYELVDADGDGAFTGADDTDGDGSIKNSTKSGKASLNDVRAVRIWVLAEGETPDHSYTDTASYVVGSHVVTPNNDHRHRLIERTVLCRNLGLEALAQ